MNKGEGAGVALVRGWQGMVPGGSGCAGAALLYVALSKASHSNLRFAPYGHNFSLSLYCLEFSF